jgi:hypothetical protein
MRPPGDCQPRKRRSARHSRHARKIPQCRGGPRQAAAARHRAGDLPQSDRRQPGDEAPPLSDKPAANLARTGRRPAPRRLTERTVTLQDSGRCAPGSLDAMPWESLRKARSLARSPGHLRAGIHPDGAALVVMQRRSARLRSGLGTPPMATGPPRHQCRGHSTLRVAAARLPERIGRHPQSGKPWRNMLAGPRKPPESVSSVRALPAQRHRRRPGGATEAGSEGDRLHNLQPSSRTRAAGSPRAGAG